MVNGGVPDLFLIQCKFVFCFFFFSCEKAQQNKCKCKLKKKRNFQTFMGKSDENKNFLCKFYCVGYQIVSAIT